MVICRSLWFVVRYRCCSLFVVVVCRSLLFVVACSCLWLFVVSLFAFVVVSCFRGCACGVVVSISCC